MTLQCSMACPGLAIHTLAGLCALWLLIAASSSGNPHAAAAPQCRPHHTCHTLQMLYLTLQCPTACPGLATHTLAGLCALWLPGSVRCGCQVLPPPLDGSTNRQNHNPNKPPPRLCCSPQCRPHHNCRTVQRLHFNLQCPMACPGLAIHTLAGL